MAANDLEGALRVLNPAANLDVVLFLLPRSRKS